ncbi:MAG: hypothetical protein H7X70_01800 [Candidatus Kapabacteria bacterium]|nr:hypothetical protein [Candidatus Kapabacteria bacterium]
MNRFADLLYSFIAIPVINTILPFLSIFHPKIRRRLTEEDAAMQHIAGLPKKQTRILFHAASMGELEQCVPIIHAIHELQPNIEIVVSCMSPSGYSHACNLPEVFAAVYLPVDTVRNARRFFDGVNVDVMIIDRYDVWPNHMREAQKRNIQVHLINATMPSMGQYRFIRARVRELYNSLTTITAVDAPDAATLSAFLGRPIPYRPDTRIDRVIERISEPDVHIQTFKRSDVATIILGSSWPPDEELVIVALASMASPQLRLIVVPHEPTEAAIAKIERHITCTRLSVATPTTDGHIVVDNIGSLLSLYSIADAAFVGGGFGAGVHSVTEPAGYGIPIACGPNFERSRDALALREQGALSVLTTLDMTKDWIHNSVLNVTSRQLRGERARAFLDSHTGSSRDYAQDIIASLNVQ